MLCAIRWEGGTFEFMGFWDCVKYLASTGAAGFALGRVMPKHWFLHDRFPYKEYLYERGGRIYEKLRIKAWQNRVPDMSKIVPSLVSPKQFSRGDTHRLPNMIQETCVAELVHGLLCLSGFACLKLWPGVGGVIITLLNLAVNLAYVAIQRYNRPRLLRLLRNTEKRYTSCAC